MQASLQSYSHVYLRRLALAYPLTVVGQHGTLCIRRRGFERQLDGRARLTIPAFEPLDLFLPGTPDRPVRCALELALADATHGRSMSEILAREIFSSPDRAWSAHTLSQGMRTTARTLRGILFAEGAALTDICRTQRLMRLLIGILCEDLPISALRRTVGWPSGSDLDAHFMDRFGISIDAASKLAAPARESN